MIRYAVIIFIFSLVVSGSSAQDARTPTKRGFDEKLTLRVDIDDNGIPDRITSRRYTRRAKSAIDESTTERFVEGHFIQFNWQKNSTQPMLKMFSYQYGTSEADYWAYELEPIGDMNGDGTTDLLFRAGDDTSEEAVLLLSKKEFFKAVYAGVFTSDLDLERKGSELSITDLITNRKLGRWNPQRELFEGSRIRWIRKDRVQLRTKPSMNSESLSLLWRGDIVKRVPPQEAVHTNREWTFVDSGFHAGWVETAQLSDTSVSSRIFK